MKEEESPTISSGNAISEDVNSGGDLEQFVGHLEKEGVTDTYEARKFKQLLEAQRPVIKAHKEYENGKLVSIDEEIEMVDDVTNQVQAFKLLLKVKGRLDQKKQTNNIKQFIGKVFISQKSEPNPSVEVHPESHTTEYSEPDEVSSSTPPHKEAPSDSIGWIA